MKDIVKMKDVKFDKDLFINYMSGTKVWRDNGRSEVYARKEKKVVNRIFMSEL